jgi:6-phosphogluconate dehydrogenase
LREAGIHFVDLGTSGGLAGARTGACFMAGGERGAVARIEPILTALAVEHGYVHAGPPGAGHFTKLVHNGIEIEDTGEVNWLVDDAMQMEVSVPVITQSVMQLLASRDQDRNWARAVAMMRHGFGNHPFGPEQRFAANRRTSRVGGFISRTGRP